MSRLSTSIDLGTGTSIRLGPAGVELEVYRLPEACAESDGCYTLGLHDDGSTCTDTCDCGRDRDCDRARTALWVGETITVGAWTWRAGLTELVGWRRTGPSVAEADLADRVAILTDALADERLTHTTTSSSLASASRRINELVDEVAEYAAGAEYGAQVRDRIAAERDRAERGALVLLVLAVILAAALAWVVIA